MGNTVRRIRAVLFDFDGTLTHGGVLDFTLIHEAIGCPIGMPVLEYIESLSEEEYRASAERTLKEFERKGAEESVPNSGAVEFLRFLRARDIPYGILTRNSRDSVETSLKNFPEELRNSFSVVISRDDDFEVKPSPAGVLHAADVLGVEPGELAVIGDFLYDIEAGRRAGAFTLFLDAGMNTSIVRDSDFHKRAVEITDHVVENLDEARRILDLAVPLQPGKLPNRMLEQFIQELPLDQSELLITPGVGEDIAAVESESSLLVLKSDPITFVAENIGRYAVTVNANDIATAGAVPRWLLTTFLLPPGTTGNEIRRIFRQLSVAADSEGIVLCGGHTEITPSVNRAVVSGFLVGTVAPEKLIRKTDMSEGDVLLMTKSAGWEGTTILAEEHAGLLEERGVSRGTIDDALSYAGGISILPEARMAAETGKVTAMHDVTEGGVVTAIEEFSAAAHRRFEIDLSAIPITGTTAELCRAAGLNPLGLIGSGSLLITVHPDSADSLEEEIRAAGIPAVRIGRVLGTGTGIEAHRDGRPAEWPNFETDEITRV
ncbi:MAG: HAD-IA family hydrolase [Spirochaetia bacterium]